MNFSQWFARQLTRHEWTQSDFARRAKVATSTVSNWASGARVPDPTSCDLIADVLRVPLDEVLAAAGHRPLLDDRILPDDPRAALWTLAKEIDWTPDKVIAAEGLFRSFIAWDRERGLAPKRRDKA